MSDDLPSVLDRRRTGPMPVEWAQPVEDSPAGDPTPPAATEPAATEPSGTANTGAPARASRRLGVGRAVARVALLAMVVGWAVLLRPQAIGGPIFYGRTLTSAMTPSIAKGEIVAAERQSTYRAGDVIVYRDPGTGGSGTMIVGRIVGGDGTTGYLAKGDRSTRPDRFHPTAAEVYGKVRVHMSLVAFVALCAVAGAILFLLVVAAWPRRFRR